MLGNQPKQHQTGKELISLLLHTELVFILDKRQWYNTDDLSLLFAVTFDGYEGLIIEKLKRGESVGSRL